MKIKNILVGTAVVGFGVALVSCELEKYDDYSVQITESAMESGSGTSLSTSTLSSTGVLSGESCDLTITPQYLASGATDWADCATTTTTTATPFGAGTSSITTEDVDCSADVGDTGRFAVAYANCDAGTSAFTQNTSEFTFS